MATVTNTLQVLINTPLQTAFDYVSDLTRHPEWSGGELKIEAVSSDPIGVGKEYISLGSVGNMEKNRRNTVRVNEYNPPNKFGFVSNDPSFGDVSHLFTFTQQGDSVLVERKTTLNLNPIFALAFRFMIYPMVGQPAMKKSFERLKENLEKK